MTATEPRFYNKNGTLTRYAFACGYLELYGDWQNRDGVYVCFESEWHVKGTKNDVRIWEAFDTVGAARKFARTIGPFHPATDAFSGI